MRRSKSNDEHAIASSRPSHRQRRPVIRTAMRNALPICLSLSIVQGFYSNTPRQSSSIRYSSLISFSVSSYLVSQGVSFIYRIVYQCRIRYIVQSGLAHRVLLAITSSPGVEHDIVIGFIFITQYIHRILVFLYPCIFYIHRIHHIHYIHSSTSHDGPRHDNQATRRPASRPVRLESNKRHEARAVANEEQEAGDDEPNDDTAQAPRSAAIG